MPPPSSTVLPLPSAIHGRSTLTIFIDLRCSLPTPSATLSPLLKHRLGIFILRQYPSLTMCESVEHDYAPRQHIDLQADTVSVAYGREHAALTISTSRLFFFPSLPLHSDLQRASCSIIIRRPLLLFRLLSAPPSRPVRVSACPPFPSRPRYPLSFVPTWCSFCVTTHGSRFPIHPCYWCRYFRSHWGVLCCRRRPL